MPNDFVSIPTGPGADIRTHNVGGVHNQFVKVAYGDADSATPVTAATPLPVAPALARNTRGAVTALAIGATATLVTYVADAAWKFRGFTARGDTDALYVIQYDGAPQHAVQTNIMVPNALLILPSADPAAASTTITLKVTNRGGAVADFEGTLLGE